MSSPSGDRGGESLPPEEVDRGLRALEGRLLAFEQQAGRWLHRTPPGFRERVWSLSRSLELGLPLSLSPLFGVPPPEELARLRASEAALRVLFARASELPLMPLAAVRLGLLLERLEEFADELRDLEGGRLHSVPFSVTAQEEEAARAFAEQVLALESCRTREGSGPVLLVVSEALRMVRERGLPVPVLEGELGARAAASEEALYVARGLRLPRDECERLLAHEIEGHLLPRLRARSFGPPARVGTAGSELEEEGYAVHCEDRAGLLSAERRHELSLRYLASLHLGAGAEPREVAQELYRRTSAPRPVADAVLRSLRSKRPREGRYLLGYLRVQAAERSGARALSFLSHGRFTLRAAEALLAAGEALPEPEGLLRKSVAPQRA